MCFVDTNTRGFTKSPTKVVIPRNRDFFFVSYYYTILLYCFNSSSGSVVEYTHSFRVLCFIERAALRILDCSSNFYTKPATATATSAAPRRLTVFQVDPAVTVPVSEDGSGTPGAAPVVAGAATVAVTAPSSTFSFFNSFFKSQ